MENLTTLVQFLSENAMTLLTALTVYILYHYTKETYLLRVEAQKQTQFQITPYLVFESENDGQVFIKNIGKGIAKDINFNPEWRIKGRVQGFSVIAPNELRPVFQAIDNKRIPVLTDQITNEYKIKIWYHDLTGNAYRATFERSYKTTSRFRELQQERIYKTKNSPRN